MLKRAGRASVQYGQIALKRRGLGSTLNKLQVSGECRVFLRSRIERFLCAANGLFGERKLSSRGNGDLINGTDSLASSRYHAPNAVNLVSKELNTHGTCGLSWEDINRVAVNVEGAWCIHFARVGVSHADEQRSYILKGNVVANGERCRKKIARTNRGNSAHQRVGACNYNDLLASGKLGDGATPGSNEGVVRRGIRPGAILAIGIAQHGVVAQPCSERARRAIRSVLSRNDQQARAGILRPKCGQHQRTSALREGQRGVRSARKLSFQLL